MSDDQSFYEIQLNTPHLVLAFLGAAVVGLAIFWLGVVVGRGQGEVGAPGDWQSAVPADESGAPAEEEPLEFYEAVDEPATQPQTAQDPAAATTDPTVPPTEEQEEGPADPAPEFRPADPDPNAPPAGEIIADSGAAPPQADASLARGWIVQVRSTTDKASADSLQASLVDAGFPAFVVSADVRGETWYRVRVGRYGTKAEAEVVEDRLVARGDVESTWVTEG